MLRTCRVQARSKFWEGSLESLFIPWFLSFCSQIWEHLKLLFPFVIHYCSWLIEIAQLILLQYFSGNECHLFGCNQLCGFCRERLERERDDGPCSWVARVLARLAGGDEADSVRVGETGPGRQSDAEGSIFQGPFTQQETFASQCIFYFFFTQVEYAHPGFTYDLVMRLVTLASIFIADEVPHYLWISHNGM